MEISKISKNYLKLVEDYVLNNEEINERVKENLEKIQEIGLKILTSGETTDIIKEYSL